jgi:hypothetical protein
MAMVLGAHSIAAGEGPVEAGLRGAKTTMVIRD